MPASERRIEELEFIVQGLVTRIDGIGSRLAGTESVAAQHGREHNDLGRDPIEGVVEGHSHTTGGFPVFEDSATYTGASAASHSVTLPASIQEGDLLVMFLKMEGGGQTPTITGWSQFGSVDGDRHHGYSRSADGTEGATQTVTLAAARPLAVVTYRFSNADTRAPEGTTTGPTTSATPDPPSHTPTAGALNYLWAVSIAARDGFTATVPANYGNMLTAERGSGDANVGTAHRTNAAASEDPGVFGLDSSEPWSAMTVSIYPATGGHGAANTISDHVDVAAITEVQGDIFVVDSDGKWNRVVIGAADEVIKSDGTTLAWVKLFDMATEALVVADAGSAAATQQDWIEVTVGGNTGYIHVFAAK